MRGVERHDVGARALLQSDDRLRQRLGSAGERRVEQRAAGRFAEAARQHVALAMLQTLRIFKLPQFVGDADQHIGIRADAKTPTGCDEIRVPEKCRRRGLPR